MTMLNKRIIAGIMDIIAVTALIWIINTLLYQLIALSNAYSIFNHSYIILSIVIIIYFTVSEGIKGQTIGKEMMHIKVVSKTGNSINVFTAFIRNLSKICWIPVILDWSLARIISNSDLRLLDKLTKTTVIPEDGYVTLSQKERNSEIQNDITLKDFENIEYK